MRSPEAYLTAVFLRECLALRRRRQENHRREPALPGRLRPGRRLLRADRGRLPVPEGLLTPLPFLPVRHAQLPPRREAEDRSRGRVAELGEDDPQALPQVPEDSRPCARLSGTSARSSFSSWRSHPALRATPTPRRCPDCRRRIEGLTAGREHLLDLDALEENDAPPPTPPASLSALGRKLEEAEGLVRAAEADDDSRRGAPRGVCPWARLPRGRAPRRPARLAALRPEGPGPPWTSQGAIRDALGPPEDAAAPPARPRRAEGAREPGAALRGEDRRRLPARPGRPLGARGLRRAAPPSSPVPGTSCRLGPLGRTPATGSLSRCWPRLATDSPKTDRTPGSVAPKRRSASFTSARRDSGRPSAPSMPPSSGSTRRSTRVRSRLDPAEPRRHFS